MKVVAAEAIETRKVRVTFDGDVDATAYIPGNYTFYAQREIEGLPVPGAAVTVVQVFEIGPLHARSVDIVVSDDLSPGVNYLISTSGITNVVPPYHRIVFKALLFPTPANREISFAGFFDHLDSEEIGLDKEAFLAVCDDVLKVLLLDVDRFTDIADPDVCPENFLDLMLADLGNPFRFELSVIDKRRLVRLLIPIAKQKGTKPGIENVIRFFMQLRAELIPSPGIGLILGVSKLDVDWILGYGEPWDFQIRVATPTGSLSTEEHARLVQLVDYMKFAQERARRIYGCLEAPRNLIANTTTPGEITLTWDSPVSGTPTGGYNIYWKDSAGVKTYNGNAVVGVTSPYTISGVPTGQTRHLVVSAVNSTGNPGFESNEVVATVI